MRGAPSRLIVFSIAAFLCVGLLFASLIGVLRPVETLVGVPLSILQQILNGLTGQISSAVNTLSDLQNLRARNEALERALINFQQELVELREIRADYERLQRLLNYVGTRRDWQYLAASVIGRDTTGLLRTIIIDRGTRDGLQVGMPVVTELGLVGRILRVGATNAQIQLVTDPNSYVNARLQITRTEGDVQGSVQGTAAGGLRMIYIPLNDPVNDGDTVATSGVGGRFPRGLVIGQVTSSRLDESKLFKEASVRTLIDFSRLEMVLVITDFEAADLSAFSTPVPTPGGQ